MQPLCQHEAHWNQRVRTGSPKLCTKTGRIEKLTLRNRALRGSHNRFRGARGADAWFRCGRYAARRCKGSGIIRLPDRANTSLYFAPHAVPGFAHIHRLPVPVDLPLCGGVRVHGHLRALSAARQPGARVGGGAADRAEVAVPSGLHRRGAGTHPRRQSHRAVEARLHVGDPGHWRGVSPPGVGAEARTAVDTVCWLEHPATACHCDRSRRRSQRRQPGDRTGAGAIAGR